MQIDGRAWMHVQAFVHARNCSADRKRKKTDSSRALAFSLLPLSQTLPKMDDKYDRGFNKVSKSRDPFSTPNEFRPSYDFAEQDSEVKKSFRRLGSVNKILTKVPSVSKILSPRKRSGSAGFNLFEEDNEHCADPTILRRLSSLVNLQRKSSN